VIGQERVVERLVIASLANGNVLVEDLPGFAKTRAIKSLSAAHDLSGRPALQHRALSCTSGRRRSEPQDR
jgi:MoxR-like ATPase